MRVDFYRHNLGREELESLKKIFNSVYLSTGPTSKLLEDKLSSFLDLPYVIGVNSGTAALHLALLALGIKNGDEIITTPLSFVATTNAILYTGAKPVFVDVEPETGNLNADLIEKAITKNTRVIMPVHLYGQMCDMKKIAAIAKKHHLKIIEDAAHCLEGNRDGIRPGQLSDFVTFSFYATKTITSGEGGAIGTHNKKFAKRLRSLRYHGMTRGAEKRFHGGKSVHWDVFELGWKYNMFDIQAALLLPQLKKIKDRLKIRKNLAKKYFLSFSKNKNINYPKQLKNVNHAWHLFTIWLNPAKRNSIINYLRNKGISTTINYEPIHLLKYYRKKFGFKKGDFPFAEKIGASTISLPLYPKLTKNQQNYVIKTVIKVLNNI